jgi:hypothetical protein
MKLKSNRVWVGAITNARQLIRYRNIMLGLPIRQARWGAKLSQAPYGYEIDPDKPGWLRPVQLQLEALYYARKFERTTSRVALAKWVSDYTGRPVSVLTLRDLFRERPPLSTYLLDLDDRIAIATCPDEEEAIRLKNYSADWYRSKYPKGEARYDERRGKKTKEVRKAQLAKRLKQGAKI